MYHVVRELAVGDQAPDFTLVDHAGLSVTLSSFREKQPVLLVFYPGDDTPGCTKQLCAIRDDWNEFQRRGVAVFGVNQAGSESHAAFIQKYGLQTPLLIDTDLMVSSAYGATRMFFNHRMIKRSVVLIDTTGVIRFLERGMPSDTDILKAIDTLYAA